MSQPTLSIVIPSYNSADFIEETMTSVLAQEGVDMEVIVADHTSSDGTWERLAPFARDPRVTLVRTEAGGGAERNFNRVSELATGRYVKLVCGDDVLLPGVLARQVALLEAHPEASVVACQRDLVDARGKTVFKAWGLRGLDDVMPGREAIRTAVLRGSNVFGEPACTMMRREDLVAHGYWDFRNPYMVDLATYVNVLMSGDFVADREVGAKFRLNGGQWSVALAKKQSTQVMAFHEWLLAEHPEIVTPSDVRRGNLQARSMAWKRRVLYMLLGKRMSS